MYRLYLKNRSGAIVGRADFDTKEKTQSLLVATAIFQDCSDMASDYELWSRDELILTSRTRMVLDQAADPPDVQRQLIMDTEIALHESDWAVSQSRKLAEKIEKLKRSSLPDASTADECPTAPDARNAGSPRS